MHRLQSDLLNLVRVKLSGGDSMGYVLSDVLHVSQDAAYRRLRGETALTIFEVQKICKAFDIDYRKVNSIVKVEVEMQDFYTYEEGGRPKLIEITTPAHLNEEYLKAFFEAIK